MLCDAGPLVAIIDRSDKNHKQCLTVLSTLRSPLVSTWPCFTEAMYLLRQYGGHPAQDELWGYVEDGIVTFHISSEAEQKRMRALMRQYKDTPMDLADASLVAAAEVLNQTRIFSTDTDFFVYQIGGKKPFEAIPNDESVLGFHTQTDQYGGFIANPLVSDVQVEAICRELEQRGLQYRDAQHITKAVCNGCDVFLTRDRKTIIDLHQSWLETRFPMIKIRRPSEIRLQAKN